MLNIVDFVVFIYCLGCDYDQLWLR